MSSDVLTDVLTSTLAHSLKFKISDNYGEEESKYIKKNGIKISGIATVFGEDSELPKEEFFAYLNKGGDMVNKAIWLEHQKRISVGHITDFLVESEGDRLHINFVLPYGDTLEAILPYLKNGFLKDLSIHYKRKVDDETGIPIKNTLEIIEVSLTSNGAVKQSVITAMHSKNINFIKKSKKKKKLIYL